ncbi:YmdB family metallophosphoesterase [Roseomonas sp. OT10]|uniref:TIGR00282 family metallophosphoesterase n=1 Tax=Roseomonas cutis TaxID=2897332 RepID=UPI001E46C237|nr:TIGR00282 family metallophosphoesterase [Roseomonas sp. OT10]UFN50645.1 YmdB family metallophosphoesterase [Roseomonas sp. OT10]
MRILFLGDVVGRSGRDAVVARLPGLRRELGVDLAVVNAENASHGFGLSPEMARAFLEAGADVLTLGNHSWDRKEIVPFIAQESRLIRPLNYPPGTPGQGAAVVEVPGGRRALVVNVMGRLFMEPLDDPFRALQAELARHALGAQGTVQAIVVDVHAEASSEKLALGHSFDGRASLVIGTHTHVPTADHQVLPEGTAYMTDAGMCGDYDSVIGMQKGPAALRFWRKVPGERLAPAEGEATLCGALVETDDATGLARAIHPLRVGGRLSPLLPPPAGPREPLATGTLSVAG